MRRTWGADTESLQAAIKTLFKISNQTWIQSSIPRRLGIEPVLCAQDGTNAPAMRHMVGQILGVGVCDGK